MSRSSWKTPFSVNNSKIDDRFACIPEQYTEAKKEKSDSTKPNPRIIAYALNGWSRSSTILPNHIGKSLKIHNGKNMLSRKVILEMVGHKMGEFAVTRKTRQDKRRKGRTLRKN